MSQNRLVTGPGESEPQFRVAGVGEGEREGEGDRGGGGEGEREGSEEKSLSMSSSLGVKVSSPVVRLMSRIPVRLEDLVDVYMFPKAHAGILSILGKGIESWCIFKLITLTIIMGDKYEGCNGS